MDPLDLSRSARDLDESGTPAALLEAARRRGDLVLLDQVSKGEVLVEFPMGSKWKRQTGFCRFVQLREPRGDAHYALVRRIGNHKRPSPSAKHKQNPQAPQLLPYAEKDALGARLGLEGAGIMAYMTGDQMHPPMVDDEDLWADPSRWRDAAAEHTRAAARLLQLRVGDRVLDIGCGIGGPARLMVDEFGVKVFGVGNSACMLDTAQRINETQRSWRDAIELELHDCQNEYQRDRFDAAWSMNMLYKVPDKGAMLLNIAAVLKPGGRLMVEDWMLTKRATDADRLALTEHFGADTFAEVDSFLKLLAESGFELVASEDLGHVGRTHLAKHHIPLFNQVIRPKLIADFPNKPESGEQMADEWVAGIEETVRLYRSDRMTYLRLVASRR